MGAGNSIGVYKPGKSTIDVPPNILRISCRKLDKLKINENYKLEFQVFGISERDFGGSYTVKLKPSNSNLKIFDSSRKPKYEFEVEKGWKFSVFVSSNVVIVNENIKVEVDGITMLSIPISVLKDKDVFSKNDIERLLDDYKKSQEFNRTGAVVGNGYCINSADKGIGALLNDSENFYSEPNIKSQGGNGIRLVNASSRAKVFESLGYVNESIVITTDNFNNSQYPTKLSESLLLRLMRTIRNRTGYHVFYYTMHGEYHVMTLLIDYSDPCEPKFSILDQGYVNEDNISLSQIDLKFLLLEQKFWYSKPKHAKDIKLWKIKKR